MKKHMNNRLVGIGAVAIGALLLSACATGTTDTAADAEETVEGPVVIASWGGKFSDATRTAFAEPFTAETGIEVQVLDTGSHVQTVQQMAAANATEWDILDGMAMTDSIKMEELGLLAHWPDALKTTLVDTYGGDFVADWGQDHSGYGAILVCNSEAVAVCPTTMTEFLDVEKFPGKRMLPGDPASFHQLAGALALGTGNPADDLYSNSSVEKLAAALEAVKPSVSVWWTAGDQQNQALLQGEADMGLMFSGRAFQVASEGVPLEINWQGVYVVGSTNVLENAPHKAAAFKYIEWMANHPEAHAKWSELMNYTTAHPDSFEFMPVETAEKLATYPANLKTLALQDYEWNVKNKSDIDTAFLDIITAG